MSKKGTFGYLDKDARKKMKLTDLKKQLVSVNALQPTTNKGVVSKIIS